MASFQETGNLHIGDLVAIYSEEVNADGFLKGVGHVDGRCVVESNNGHPGNPPNNFIECWLKLCPVSRCSAQKQLSQVHSTVDTALVNKLKQAVKLECKQNEQDCLKMQGNIVKYGDMIQLKHFKSNKLVSMSKQHVAVMDRCAIRVSLDSQYSENSWFYILPYYKLRSTGENIVLGDKVIFLSVNTQQSLHVSQITLPDFSSCHEVNGMLCSASWKVSLVMSYKDDRKDILKGGDIVKMFHVQREEFLTCTLHNEGFHILLKKPEQDRKPSEPDVSFDCTNSGALWEVQVLNSDPCLGGAGHWGSLFRFKHLSTGLYLCVLPDQSERSETTKKFDEVRKKSESVSTPPLPSDLLPDKTYVLGAQENRDKDWTIFQLEPSTLQDGDIISRSERSYVRLFHPHTNSWARSTIQEVDPNHATPCLNEVICSIQGDNKEAFAFKFVCSSKVRDLEFSADASKMIRNLSANWEIGTNLTQNTLQHMIQLLEEIIYYLLDDKSKSGDPLLVGGNVNRERQELVREQDILLELFRLMRVPFGSQNGIAVLRPNDLKSKEYEKVAIVFRLSYRILKLAQEDCVKNQEYIAENFIDVMQSHIGLDVFAEDTITSLVNKNHKLLVTHINLPEIQVFIDLLRNKQDVRFLAYLSELCVPKGSCIGSTKIQELVYTTLTKPHNRDVLVQIGYQDNNVVLTRKIGGHNLRPQIGVVMNALSGCQVDTSFLAYYRYQLELFANLCVGRTYFQKDLKEILPVELAFRCLTDTDIPTSLRATYCKVIRLVHLDSRPQEIVPPVEYARLWVQISSSQSNIVVPSSYLNLYMDDTPVDSNSTHCLLTSLPTISEAQGTDLEPIVGISEFNSRVPTGIFYKTALYVLAYFQQRLFLDVTNAVDFNQLTLEITNLAFSFVTFGFYTFTQMLELNTILLELLDYLEREEKCLSNSGYSANRSHTLDSLHLNIALTKSLNQVTFNKAYGKEIIRNLRCRILEIIQYVMDVRLDFRISNFLVNFKTVSNKILIRSNDNDGMTNLDLDFIEILENAEKTFNGNEQLNLSLDGSKGQRLTKVLVTLASECDHQIFVASFKLLFRHFLQHKELLDAIKQVQVLVTDKEVENYNVIKNSLDELKKLIETAEQWIMTSQKAELYVEIKPRSGRNNSITSSTRIHFEHCNALHNDDKFKLPSARISSEESIIRKNGQRIVQIFKFLTDLCDCPEPQHQQRLLRKMGAHLFVLDFLQLFSLNNSDEVTTKKCVVNAHLFLQKFCYNEPRNQELLFENIDLFFCCKDTEIQDINTLLCIFDGNMNLCNRVGEKLIRQIVRAIGNDKSEKCLQLLYNLVKVGSTYIKKNQDLVMKEKLRELMQESDEGELPLAGALSYHLNLVRLLTVCTVGKNAVTELKCQSLLSLDSILQILREGATTIEVKEEYLNLVVHCYIDTELEYKESSIKDSLWNILKLCLLEIAEVKRFPEIMDRKCSFICETVISFIHNFFSSFYIEIDIISIPQNYHDLFTQLIGHLFRLMQSKTICSSFHHFSIRKLFHLLFELARDNGIPLSKEMEDFFESDSVSFNQFATSVVATTKTGEHISRKLIEMTFRKEVESPIAKIRSEDSSIELGLQELILHLEQFYQSMLDAEESVLVTIFSFPELLKMDEMKSFVELGEDTSFIGHIISCTEKLWERREDELVLKLLSYLEKSLEPYPEINERGKVVRNELMYTCVTGFNSREQLVQLFDENRNTFAIIIEKIDNTFNLIAKQNRLCLQNAPYLAVSLIMNCATQSVFNAAIKLGIALLEGGNGMVQQTFLDIFTETVSEKFFACLHQKFTKALTELNNSYFKTNDSNPYTESAIYRHRLSVYNNGEDVVGSIELSNQRSRYVYSLAHNLLNSDDIIVIHPICRFLQLLCENHNIKLQHYLLFQHDHKVSYNLVLDTLQVLVCMCGGSSGGLGLLGLYINKKNVHIIRQCLITLTEYCQGPCHKAQNCIALFESTGIDIIVSLVVNDISPLSEERMDLVVELKNFATKTLLAIIESRTDSEIADKILLKMRMPVQLVDICKKSFLEGLDENEFERDISRGIGHNLYILLSQLSSHSKELADALQENSSDPAFSYYAEHTEMVEIVRSDKTMERITFPVPTICKYLTGATKDKIFLNTDRDETDNKVSEFFSKVDGMYQEMLSQKNLEESNWQYWISLHSLTWNALEFSINVIINLIIALFYPYPLADARFNSLTFPFYFITWILCLALLSCSLFLSKLSYTVRIFLLSLSVVGIEMLCFGPYLGLEILAKLLGIVLLINKAINFICKLGNKGALSSTSSSSSSSSSHWSERPFKLDCDFLSHGCYTLFAVLGLIIHPFFYPFLLFDIVYREETLKNIIKSIMKGGSSLLLTILLGCIVIYQFSIIGYLFFQKDFVNEAFVMTDDHRVTSVRTEYLCNSLFMCILTTLNNGLRNDGGIGDSLRSPSIDEPSYVFRIIYDLTFFFCVIIIMLNMVLGVIVDAFTALRKHKSEKENILKHSCFICGLKRSAFDGNAVTFEDHISKEHNLWHYLHFIILLKQKIPTEFTGPESYVAKQIKDGNLDWFPLLNCMSLEQQVNYKKDYNFRNLHITLDSLCSEVQTLADKIHSNKHKAFLRSRSKSSLDIFQAPPNWIA